MSRSKSPSAAIAGGNAGRPKGSGKLLSPDIETALLALIVSRPPSHLSGSQPLWDKAAIRGELSQRFHRDVPERTITDYLRRWGLYAEIPETDPDVLETIMARARSLHAQTVFVGQMPFRIRHDLVSFPELNKHAARQLVMRFAIHGQGKGKLRFLVQECRDGEAASGVTKFVERLGRAVTQSDVDDAATAPKRRKARIMLILIGLEHVGENERTEWTKQWKADVEIVDLPVKSEPMFPDRVPPKVIEVPIRTHKMQR